jgi:hypothetical protein
MAPWNNFGSSRCPRCPLFKLTGALLSAIVLTAPYFASSRRAVMNFCPSGVPMPVMLS